MLVADAAHAIYAANTLILLVDAYLVAKGLAGGGGGPTSDLKFPTFIQPAGEGAAPASVNEQDATQQTNGQEATKRANGQEATQRANGQEATRQVNGGNTPVTTHKDTTGKPRPPNTFIFLDPNDQTHDPSVIEDFKKRRDAGYADAATQDAIVQAAIQDPDHLNVALGDEKFARLICEALKQDKAALKRAFQHSPVPHHLLGNLLYSGNSDDQDIFLEAIQEPVTRRPTLEGLDSHFLHAVLDKSRIRDAVFLAFLEERDIRQKIDTDHGLRRFVLGVLKLNPSHLENAAVLDSLLPYLLSNDKRRKALAEAMKNPAVRRAIVDSLVKNPDKSFLTILIEPEHPEKDPLIKDTVVALLGDSPSQDYPSRERFLQQVIDSHKDLLVTEVFSKNKDPDQRAEFLRMACDPGPFFIWAILERNDLDLAFRTEVVAAIYKDKEGCLWNLSWDLTMQRDHPEVAESLVRAGLMERL
jgi:hypothetical protein